MATLGGRLKAGHDDFFLWESKVLSVGMSFFFVNLRDFFVFFVVKS